MKPKQKPTKYHDILLTDVQVHITKPRKPISWYKVIMKSLRNKMPGRFFTKNISRKKNGTSNVIFEMPANIQQEIKKAKRSGEKIRLLVPKGGLPIFPGPDVIEKLKAKKKKKKPLTRVWRNDNIK